MRTATDFNQFYAVPDPWRITRATVRDKNLRRRLSPLVEGKSVLDLGCGEGHVTEIAFSRARSVTGVDISAVAIERANKRRIANTTFESADFLEYSFSGYDVICALECLYYLNPVEQNAFFNKVAVEHPDRMLVVSGPIIGGYFSHEELMQGFKSRGFSLFEAHNLTAYWRPLSARITANLMKLPLGHYAIDWLPERMVYQRLYVVQTSAKHPN